VTEETPEDSFVAPVIKQKYDAIPCKEYINGPYWDAYSQVEKNAAIAQL